MSVNPELQAILSYINAIDGSGGTPMVSKKDAGMITDWDTMMANPHLINPEALRPITTLEPYFGEGDAFLQMYQNGDAWQKSIAAAVLNGQTTVPGILEWIKADQMTIEGQDFDEEGFAEATAPIIESLAEPLVAARLEDQLKIQTGEIVEQDGQYFTSSTEPHPLDVHAMNSGYVHAPSETFSPYILFEEGRQEDDARIAARALEAQQAYDSAVAAWEEQYRDEWEPWRSGPAGHSTNSVLDGGAGPVRGASDTEMAAVGSALGAGAQLPDEPKERPPLPTYAEDVSAQPYVGVDLGTGLPNIPGVDLEAMLTTPSATPSGQTGGMGFDVANAARRIAEEQNYVPPMDDRVHETYMRAISTNDGSDQQYIAPQFIRADESSLRKGRSNGEAAYRYLPKSVAHLPEPHDMVAMLHDAGFGGGIVDLLGGGTNDAPFNNLAGRWGQETPTYQTAQHGGHTYFSNGGRVKNITEAERERRKQGELQTLSIIANSIAKQRDKQRQAAEQHVQEQFTSKGITPFGLESITRNASGGIY